MVENHMWVKTWRKTAFIREQDNADAMWEIVGDGWFPQQQEVFQPIHMEILQID